MLEDLTVAKMEAQDLRYRSRSLLIKSAFQTADSIDQKIAEQAWKLRLGIVKKLLPVKRKIDFEKENLDASMRSQGMNGANNIMGNPLLEMSHAESEYLQMESGMNTVNVSFRNDDIDNE